MHEYIEVRFRKDAKRLPIVRQGKEGFEFAERDPPQRKINLGFRAYDAGTRHRMQRIRQVKGWGPDRFDIKVSTEDGSLVLRGDDRWSLPEGWYEVTANIDGAKVKKIDKRRVEVIHDGHGSLTIDLELDERTIEVDLEEADEEILRVLDVSTLDGDGGRNWVQNPDVRPTRRACALNLLTTLRLTPTKSAPLIRDVDCFFRGRDDRTYARVKPSFYERIHSLADDESKPVYEEGPPHARIHEELLSAISEFDSEAAGFFTRKGLISFRSEGRPSLQMVIARPSEAFPMEFADLDLDLGNPLQDVVGLSIHIGELLDGKPTNHLDIGKQLLKAGKTADYVYYKVINPKK
jgi:hypothetical protein